jgi:hypothetical protein
VIQLSDSIEMDTAGRYKNTKRIQKGPCKVALFRCHPYLLSPSSIFYLPCMCRPD